MSSKFETALKNELNDEISITENGAVGFKTSGKKLVDLNFSTSSLRKATDDEITKKFSDAFYENKLLAVKWLFFARDIRGGMGERNIFRVCLKWIASTDEDLAKALVPIIAEYGRYDDLFAFEGTTVWQDVVKLIDKQLTADYEACKAKKSFSLLAKWMPSVNTSSTKTKTLAKKLAKELDLTEKQYRKMLSELRAALKVVEVNASANDWSEIDYNAVPSQANLKYKNAFLKHDEVRRRAYLEELNKPDSKAKINASTAFPCDIVRDYSDTAGWRRTLKAKDETLEAMWKALPNYVAGNDSGSTIVVADGSGSMTSCVSGSMTALDVANSLAIYFAEKLDGPYKDKYITFSMKPQYVDFSKAKSLREKLAIALKHDECANTNVEAVFDLILDAAIKNNLSQDDIPANVLIVSDMEFDSCAYDNSVSNNGYGYYGRTGAVNNALFTKIAKRYEAEGYKLPRLVFWNVCSRTMTIPVQTNKAGVALVSGFSPAIAQMVFSAKTSPYDVLVDMLNKKRYDIVEKAIANLVA